MRLCKNWQWIVGNRDTEVAHACHFARIFAQKWRARTRNGASETRAVNRVDGADESLSHSTICAHNNEPDFCTISHWIFPL
ncbi:hypothetical protein D3C80_2102370 [compost metagenome]